MAIDYGTQRPGAPRQRHRSRPAPRRRGDLHVDVRRLRVRGDLRAERPLSATITPIPPCRTRPCSAIVGTGSTCGCSKWCRASTSCRQAIDRYSTSTGSYGEPIKLTQKLPKGEVLSGNRMPQGPDGLLSRQRRRVDSVARAGPQQQLLQPVGHATRCAAAA